MTKTAIVENNEHSYVVCTIDPSEAKQIIKEHQEAEAKSVATSVSARSKESTEIKSNSSKCSSSCSSCKKISTRSAKNEEDRDVKSVPGSVSVPSVKSGDGRQLHTVWEEESRDDGAVSTTSSVSSYWDLQGKKSVWEKKYEGERKINDVLRKQLRQRDGEIEHLGQQAYKKVQKLRAQRELRDEKIAELEKKIAQREDELVRERESHDSTKAALKVQLEDNVIAQEEAVTMKHKATLLEHRMQAIGKAFGKIDDMPKPSNSISPRKIIKRQSSARAA